MKVGELYEVRHTWLLPHSTSDFWSSCGPVLYVGEDAIVNQDGKKIVNYVVLAGGERRVLDQSFLKFLEPISCSNRKAGV